MAEKPDTMTQEQVTTVQEKIPWYRIKIEHAAGVKTGDGFVVEVEHMSQHFCKSQIQDMYAFAQTLTKQSIPAVTTKAELKDPLA